MEVFHPDQPDAERARLLALSHDLGLLATGGSDDHGSLTGYRIGAETAAAGVYEALVAQTTGSRPAAAANPRYGAPMALASARPHDVRRAFHEELDAGQRAALLSWLAFTATFGAVRGITYSIKNGKGPFGNLSVGGEHLHHYMWGIGLISGVGGVAVHGDSEQPQAPGRGAGLRRRARAHRR